MFIKENLNPTGKSSTDCVVRAIMKATGQTWAKTYQDLCEVGLKEFDMPNSKKVWSKYLEQQGYVKQKMPRFPNNTRYTLEEFAKEYKKGTYIIKLAHHVTTVIDGHIYDSWDCSHKSVGNYWSKKGQ